MPVEGNRTLQPRKVNEDPRRANHDCVVRGWQPLPPRPLERRPTGPKVETRAVKARPFPHPVVTSPRRAPPGDASVSQCACHGADVWAAGASVAAALGCGGMLGELLAFGGQPAEEEKAGLSACCEMPTSEPCGAERCVCPGCGQGWLEGPSTSTLGHTSVTAARLGWLGSAMGCRVSSTPSATTAPPPTTTRWLSRTGCKSEKCEPGFMQCCHVLCLLGLGGMACLHALRPLLASLLGRSTQGGS